MFFLKAVAPIGPGAIAYHNFAPKEGGKVERQPGQPGHYLPPALKVVKERLLAGLLFLMVICLTPAPAPAQELAAWITRFDIDTAAKINQVCAPATAATFDRLLVQVRGRADAWYKSEVAPAPAGLAPGFDPLGEMQAACGQDKLTTWLNVYYLWTGTTPPADPHHPALSRPWLLQDDQGRPVDSYNPLMQKQHWLEGIYADPGSSAYRHYFSRVVAELLDNYGPKAIHLDFVRYPNSMFGAGNELAQRFQALYGFDPRWLPGQVKRTDIAAWLDGSLPPGTELLVSGRLIWDLLRASQVSELVGQVAELVHERPATTLSAAVFPEPLAALLDKGQDWPAWLAQGSLDNAFVMTYFGDQERLRNQLAEVRQVVGEKDQQRLWVGLGAYIKSAEVIGRESRLCREMGLERLGLFSLGHIQRKKNGLAPYRLQTKQPGPAPANLAKNGAQLEIEKDYLYLAVKDLQNLLSNKRANGAGDPRVARRLLRFQEKHGLIPATVAELASESHPEPFWLESRGIFRFLDRHDSLATGEEQLNRISQAREKLLAGADFKRISEKMSQAGSRHEGGMLPRHYLAKAPAWASELGAISPVLPAANGFWVKQVMARGGGQQLPLARLEWPARRIILSQRINDHAR